MVKLVWLELSEGGGEEKEWGEVRAVVQDDRLFLQVGWDPWRAVNRGEICPDSGVHNDLWLLWTEQTGGASEGGSRRARAEAIAGSRWTIIEDWGSSLRSPWDHRSGITRLHHPHLPVEETKAPN